MGTKDSTQKRLEDFNDVFADIVNVLLFDGKQIIKEDESHATTTCLRRKYAKSSGT